MVMLMSIDKAINSVGIKDEIKIIKIKYGFEIIKNESIKLVILLIIFLCVGMVPEFIFASFVLLPMRFFAGGLHMNSNITCFLFSLGFFLLAIFVSPLVLMNQILAVSLLSLSAIIIVFLSPIASQKRPISTKERYKFLKRNACVLTIIEFIVLLIILRMMPYNFFLIGVWIFCLQAVQMIVSKIILIRKGISK